MMHIFESIPLLTVLAIVAKCDNNGQEKGSSAKPAGSSNTKSNLMVYILDQLYVMKSKVQHLEKGGKEMKLALEHLEKGGKEMKRALNSCKRRIQVIETRKETRCESGTLRHYGVDPIAKWPYSRRINFKSPFNETPTLTYGLYALDASNGANLRVDTVVTNLSRTGFQLTLRTWADTKLYGAFASWMACGK